MKRKFFAIPAFVLFLMLVTAVTAFAQETPITSTVAITVDVQKPSVEVRYTHEYSFPVTITNTGEFTASVSGEVLLYYAHVTDITTTVPITANYAFTPTAFRSSAAFTLTEPVAPGEVVTLTVICAQDQTPGPVWADIEITATPLVTDVLETSLFSTIAWDAQTPYDFSLTMNISPTNILSGGAANLMVSLQSNGDITETRTIIGLKGFGVTDYFLLGDAAGPVVRVAFLTAAQAAAENAKLDKLKASWKARKEHYISHMAAAMIAHPEFGSIVASQVYTDPIFVTFAEGDPIIFWNPEEAGEFVLSFVLIHDGDADPAIFGSITGPYFTNLPPGELWKYEWDGDNVIRLLPDRDFSIVAAILQVFMPLIQK